MTVRDLKVFPKDEHFLRVKSEPVELAPYEKDGDTWYVVPPEVSTLIDDMYDTLFAFRAAGLSAVQVGEHKRVIVYLDTEGSPKALINPFIVRETVEEEPELLASTEGCLSFPGVHEVITKTRVAEVVVEGVTETGEKIQVFLTDQQAIAAQHEIDHLNGVLFIDHMGKTARRLALKRLKKVEKRIEHAKQNFEKMQSRRFAA